MQVIRIDKVLVVDDAAVVREMLAAVLSAHCSQIHTAQDVDSARKALREHPDFSLVLCDVVLPDGTGIGLLEEIAALDSAPDVILMTGRPSHEDAVRAHALGAIGYLSKPISFRAVAQVLRQDQGKRNALPRVRGVAVGQAYLFDPLEVVDAPAENDPRRVWNIRDMSLSGAFLETSGPIEPGTVLDLCLDFGDAQLRVQARAVRVQEPDWGKPAGVGIAFEGLGAASREQLASRLARIVEFH